MAIKHQFFLTSGTIVWRKIEFIQFHGIGDARILTPEVNMTKIFGIQGQKTLSCYNPGFAIFAPSVAISQIANSPHQGECFAPHGTRKIRVAFIVMNRGGQGGTKPRVGALQGWGAATRGL